MKKIVTKSKAKPKSLPLGDFLTKLDKLDKQKGAGDLGKVENIHLASEGFDSHRNRDRNRNASASVGGGGDRVRLNRTTGGFRSNRGGRASTSSTSLIALPTAPRAKRALEEDKSIPHRPPYVAFINNLPFNADENDVRQLFYPIQIKSLRLPREDRFSKRSRGFAYLEFQSRQELISVLSMEEPILRGRRVRIEISNNNEGFNSHGPSGEGRGPWPDDSVQCGNTGEVLFNMEKEFPALKPCGGKSHHTTFGLSESRSSGSVSVNNLSVARSTGNPNNENNPTQTVGRFEQMTIEEKVQMRLQQLAEYENGVVDNFNTRRINFPNKGQ